MSLQQNNAAAAEIAAPYNGKQSSGRWRVRCPAHDGTSDNSLSIWDTENGIAVKCFNECTTEEIKRSLGIWRESSRPSVLPSLTAEPVDQDRLATFDYEYPNGSEAFKVLRTDKPDGSKTFAQQTGGEWKAHPAPRPLYRSQRIAEERDATVLVVEGEKTAHAAQALFSNMAVTTSSGGSKAAAKSDWSVLKGRNVIVWPDNDEPGRAYAHEVARLCGSAATVRMVSLPEGLPTGWDLADELGSMDVHKLVADARSVGRLQTITAQALCAEPDAEYEWLVDGMLTLPGTSMLVGSPKAGKSTLARRLAVAVASGRQFLGMNTTKGDVLLAAIDESKNIVKRDLRVLAPMLGGGSLAVLTRDSKPDNEDRLPMLRECIARTRPRLVIIDTVGRWVENFDEFRYAEVGNAMQPFSDIADEFGCHVLLTHHSRKGGTGQIEDALGSQSFSGGVDTVMLTWRTPAEAYMFRAIGRADVDFKRTGLKMDGSGWVDLDSSQDQMEALRGEIAAEIRGGNNTQMKLLKALQVGKPKLTHAIGLMLPDGLITSDGAGTRSSPYTYTVAKI